MLAVAFQSLIVSPQVFPNLPIATFFIYNYFLKVTLPSICGDGGFDSFYITQNKGTNFATINPDNINDAQAYALAYITTLLTVIDRGMKRFCTLLIMFAHFFFIKL
jgi:hypothetical protein